MADINKAIKIPAEHYIGLRQGHSGLPYADMIINGNDSATKQRKLRVNSYSSSKTGHVLVNEPMHGFRLLDRNQKLQGWLNKFDSWVVEDPRGFKISITAGNLQQIMSCATLDNGEILDQCVWGKEGPADILIPVTSEVYLAARENTERMSKKVSKRDIKLGDRVVLQNGEEKIYLGCYYPIIVKNSRDGYRYDSTSVDTRILDDKRNVYGIYDKNKKVMSSLEIRGHIKVAETYSEFNYTPEQAQQVVQNYLNTKKSVYCTSFNHSDVIVGVTSDKNTKFSEFFTRQLTKEEMLDGIEYSYNRHKILLAKTDVFGLIIGYNIKFDRSGGNLSFPESMTQIDQNIWTKEKLIDIKYVKKIENNWRSSSRDDILIDSTVSIHTKDLDFFALERDLIDSQGNRIRFSY
jgi:hypothetical protein